MPRRTSNRPERSAWLQAAGLTFDQKLGFPDRALEVVVTDLPFLFWQYYGE